MHWPWQPKLTRAYELIGAEGWGTGVLMWLFDFPDEWLQRLALLASGVLGLCVGSFLSVVVHRLPLMMRAEWEGRPALLSLARPRSHCPACGESLRWWENIPLFSYLVVLKGRCGHCGVRIAAVYPCMEAMTCAVSVATVWRLGGGWASVWALVLVWALVALVWIDAREQLLPDDITLPLAWLGLLVNLDGTFVDLPQAVLGAVLGYLSLWSIFWLFKLVTGKDGMGRGDFKLMAALGAWLGWMAVPWVVFVASVLSALFGLTVALVKKEKGQQAMAFGPFLALAGWAMLLLGR